MNQEMKVFNQRNEKDGWSLSLWEKSGKSRMYLRAGRNDAGYITLDEDDVSGGNTGREGKYYYCGKRPGLLGDLRTAARELLEIEDELKA